MLISHERRFIFIHNFKTGGTSIRRALAGVALEQPSSIWLVQAALHYARPIGRIANRAMTRPPLARAGVMPKHNTAAQAKAILPDFIWRGYFKFGFVRNPWSREYSNFGMFRRSHPDRVPDSFEAYVHDYLPDNFFTQTAFFYDDRGERLVDFVGRFETLNQDFATVAQRLGLAVELPRLNASGRGDDYRDHYTPAMVERVATIYDADIKNFGYDFG